MQYKLKLKSKLMPIVNMAMSLTACQEGTPLEAVKFVRSESFPLLHPSTRNTLAYLVKRFLSALYFLI